MTTLYIAEHNVTGLKYFGRTVNHHTIEDLQKKYHGSGTYWKNHLKKHGDNITMKILHSSEDAELIKSLALMYSKFWNIVESSDYANLIIEDGTISCGMLGLKHSEETKEKLRLANTGFIHTDETKEKISVALKKYVKSEEHRESIRKQRTGTTQPDSVKDKISKKKLGCKWVKKGSVSKTIYTTEIEEYLSNGWIFGRNYNKKGKING